MIKETVIYGDQPMSHGVDESMSMFSFFLSEFFYICEILMPANLNFICHEILLTDKMDDAS